MQPSQKTLIRSALFGIAFFMLSQVMGQAKRFPAAAPRQVPPPVKKVAPKAVGAQDSVITVKRNQNLGTGPKATGIIKDAATGKPLAAINVTIPDFSAALTDANGKFIINVPNYKVALFVSAEGFQSKEVPLKGRKEITASLYEESFISQYDNAFMPLGPKPLNQLTSAVVSLSPEGAWNRTAETADGYLQAKVAGMDATVVSGTAFSGATLALRGYSSLYGTNQPLIVVDGMIYDNNDYGTSLIAKHTNNPLAEIDMKDIENITVIKDAASLYGTKGANGVILITTSHAKQLATKIDFGVFTGFNFAPKELPVMNSADYRTYLSDVLKTRGMSDNAIQAQPYMDDNPLNPGYARYHNETDWQKQVFQNSSSSNYFLKVSGGDDIAKYALSMGYAKNNGITKNTDATRLNTRFNADLNLTKKFTANTNLSFTYYEENLRDQGLSVKTNPLYLALVKSPFFNPNQISDNGVKSPNLADTDTLGVGNPSAAVGESVLGKSQVYRFFGSVNLKYQLNNNFAINMLGGLTFDKVREQIFIPRLGIASDTLINAIARSRLGSQVKRVFTTYVDAFADYNKKIGAAQRLNARIGFRYQSTQNEQDVATSFNSATDDFISVGTGVTTLRRVGGDLGANVWTSLYLAAEYSLYNKYFVSFNGAVDGSSKFGPQARDGIGFGGSRLAVMPSLGLSWLVSSEKFMAHAKFIDLFKLRATYSKTGNDDIGNYSYRQSYISQNFGGTATTGILPQLIEGLVRGNVGNPKLQWETNNKLNVGLDLALFNERLSFNLDFYHNTTNNMITYEPLPVATGFPFAITNSGGMKTDGLDLAVNARIINNRRLKWDVGFIITKYKNTITQLPAGDITTKINGATVLTSIGSPANVFYGWKTNGIMLDNATAASANLKKKNADGSFSSFKGGDVRFVDVNGDGIIDDNDRQVIGNPNPNFTGGISTKLTYKAFSLEALINFSQGNSLYNAPRAILESQSSANNQLQSVNNRWRADGQMTTMPKAAWGDPMGNNRFSDRWIEDGSFMRLKVLTISYNVALKQGSFIKNMTLYATGNNLVTFTQYLGYDPEFSASSLLFSRGVDVLMEPQYKSLVVGVRIGL